MADSDWKSRSQVVAASTNDWKSRSASLPGEPGPSAIGDPNGNVDTFKQNYPALARYRDSAINSLPMVGTVIGGALATPETLGAGTVPGAMMGGTAGLAAKKVLEHVRDHGIKSLWDFSQAPTVQGVTDQFKDYGVNALESGMQEMGGQVATKALSKGAELAAPYVPEALKGLPAMLKQAYIKSVGKVGSAFTGVPETEIATQMTRPTAVQALNDEAKTALDSRVGNAVTDQEKKRLVDPQAAQMQQQKIFDDVMEFKQAQNKSITEALNSSKVPNKPATINYQLGDAQGNIPTPPAGTIPLKPVLDAIDEGSGRINATLDPGAMEQVKALRARVQAMASSQGGVVDMNELNQIRKHLQDVAEAAFQNSKLGFSVGDSTAQTAKKGWGAAKELMDTHGPAEIKMANSNLSKLHDVEDTLNKNLVTPGATSSPLLAVGSGETAGAAGTNRLALADLGKLTGNDYIQQAENLSAMQRFRNPSLLPVDSTGKGAVRVGLGYGVGKLASSATGIPGLEYAVPALSSPMALKYGLKLQGGVGDLASKLNNPQIKGALMRAIYQSNQGDNQ